MKQLEIKKIAKDIWQKISPIKGVLYFMIILLVIIGILLALNGIDELLSPPSEDKDGT